MKKKADTVIVLAGGKSKRMGMDKSCIIFNGKTLLDHMLDSLEGIFEKIIIVGNNQEAYEEKYRVLKDEITNCGPLAGLYTGLKVSNSQYVCLMPCDMPFVNISYLKYIKALVEEENFCKDVLMTQYKDDMVEPFCAFYSQSNVAIIEKMFALGIKNVSGIIKFSEVEYVKEKKAREYSPNWEMFININTHEDLKRYGKGETY